MKKYILLSLILIITIASLYGCNRDNESTNKNVKTNTSESISQKGIDEQIGDSISMEDNEVSNNEIETDNKNDNVESSSYAKDSTTTEHYDVQKENKNNKNVVNSTSSSVSNDEENEAEINFSELE